MCRTTCHDIVDSMVHVQLTVLLWSCRPSHNCIIDTLENIKVFSKNLINFLLCVDICKWGQLPVDGRSIRPPWLCSYRLWDWVWATGTKPRSSTWAACALHCSAISPVPLCRYFYMVFFLIIRHLQCEIPAIALHLAVINGILLWQLEKYLSLLLMEKNYESTSSKHLPDILPKPTWNE